MWVRRPAAAPVEAREDFDPADDALDERDPSVRFGERAPAIDPVEERSGAAPAGETAHAVGTRRAPVATAAGRRCRRTRERMHPDRHVARRHEDPRRPFGPFSDLATTEGEQVGPE